MKSAARDLSRSASVRKVLARPALHVVLALVFAVSFFWPIFAMEKPARTFNFLYLVWFICLAALFAVSRGEEAREDDEEEASDDAPGGTS
jgi:predicted membrane protein